MSSLKQVIGLNTAVIAGATGTGFAIPEDTVSARVGSILKRCGPAHAFLDFFEMHMGSLDIVKRPDESECPAKWHKGAQLVWGHARKHSRDDDKVGACCTVCS